MGMTADLGLNSSPPAAYADHCAVRPATGAPLSTGSHGDQVWILQPALTNAGHGSGYQDGVFGSPEREAVMGFQQSRGLAATGVVDAATWQALGPFIDGSQARHAAAQPSYGQTSATFNAAGFNALFPGQPYFGLQAMSTRAGSAPSPPYIPPTLSKSIGWIESAWRQVHGSAAPLISTDCGYGITQITYPGVPLPGADGTMVSWGMKDRAPGADLQWCPGPDYHQLYSQHSVWR